MKNPPILIAVLGFFGALAFICLVALAFGWVYDRRHQRESI